MAVVLGTEGADGLLGTTAPDTIRGFGGNDILDGRGTGGVPGTGDWLFGGLGDDLYYVYSGFDRLREYAGEGTDTILTATHYRIGNGISIEVLRPVDFASTLALNLTGNELAQRLEGNAGTNILNGAGGNDLIHGYASDDRLYGGSGDDDLRGGSGNDRYYVDSASDAVVEFAGEGADIIYASTNYTLGAGVHVETLRAASDGATVAIDLAGNDLANILSGNAGHNILAGAGGQDTLYGRGGNDTLSGGFGADIMRGGTGDDFYIVDNSDDRVIEYSGEGWDTVRTYVDYTLGANQEVAAIAEPGSINQINLTGNALQNELYGSDGNNVLDGKLGADALIGGGGDDVFAFTTALGSGNIDVVAGFQVGHDKIALDDAIFAALDVAAAEGMIGQPVYVDGTDVRTLSAGAFVVGTAAQDSDDRIIFNSETGALLYDSDGTGAAAALQFAIVDLWSEGGIIADPTIAQPVIWEGMGSLSASDFIII